MTSWVRSSDLPHSLCTCPPAPARLCRQAGYRPCVGLPKARAACTRTTLTQCSKAAQPFSCPAATRPRWAAWQLGARGYPARVLSAESRVAALRRVSGQPRPAPPRRARAARCERVEARWSPRGWLPSWRTDTADPQPQRAGLPVGPAGCMSRRQQPDTRPSPAALLEPPLQPASPPSPAPALPGAPPPGCASCIPSPCLLPYQSDTLGCTARTNRRRTGRRPRPGRPAPRRIL